jgi:hypothetical protein
LVHSRSIRHCFVNFESCQDTRGNVLVRTFLFAFALFFRGRSRASPGRLTFLLLDWDAVEKVGSPFLSPYSGYTS